MSAEHISRRRFLQRGAKLTEGYLLATQVAARGEIVFTAAVVGIKASEGISAIRAMLKAKDHFDPLLNPPEIPNTYQDTTTIFDKKDWERTHLIVFGDSIAQGYLEDRPYQFNIAHFMVQLSRHIPSIRWEWTNHSWNGATSEDAAAKIKKTDMGKYSDGKDMRDRPVSVIYSGGGNDVLKKIAQEAFNDVQRWLADPSNEALARALTHKMLEAIQGYQESFSQVLEQLKKKREEEGVNFQRLYVLGVPNMSFAQKVQLKDGEELELNGVTRELAGIFSRYLNNATHQALQEKGNFGFDVLYIDTYRLLGPEHIKGMHPTEEGQKLMAYEVLKRSKIYGTSLDSDFDGYYSLLEVIFGTQSISEIQKDPRSKVSGIYPRS